MDLEVLVEVLGVGEGEVVWGGEEKTTLVLSLLSLGSCLVDEVWGWVPGCDPSHWGMDLPTY